MGLFAWLWELPNMYNPLIREPDIPVVLPSRIPYCSLDAAGLVALADLSTVARRTALTGTSVFLDSLVLCPGLHRQQNAIGLNDAEYPICAAMTSGYVFRIENQATVHYLQRIGRPGQLTCLSVAGDTVEHSARGRLFRSIFDFENASFVSVFAYWAAVMLMLAFLLASIFVEDWWALAVVGTLTSARLVNVVVIRRRAAMGWKGEPEPGKKSDLIVLMSQDRWIRMQGATDDVKAITSGEWLRESKMLESAFSAFATLSTYLNAALACNMGNEAKIMLTILLFLTAGLLGVVNEYTAVFKMYGRAVKVDRREKYGRRLQCAKQLIKDQIIKDNKQPYEWALRLGMVQPRDVESMKQEGIIPTETEGGADLMLNKESQVVL